MCRVSGEKMRSDDVHAMGQDEGGRLVITDDLDVRQQSDLVLLVLCRLQL